MSKFKVRFKVEKLELDIEGERQSVPEVTQAIQKHLSSLLMAPAVLAGGNANGGAHEKTITDAVDITSSRRNKRRPSTRGVTGSGGDKQNLAIDFKHNPEQWGNPLQGWSASRKAIWLLFVAKNQFEVKEMSSNVITETFNKHFRSAGAIRSFTVTRDLGKLKSKSPAWVGEDATQTPPAWYLVAEGENVARKLVSEATGTPAQI
jgi:hypothetical protein